MDGQLDHLLLDLYGCPEEPARWPVVLDQVCRETHARSAVIQCLVNDGARPWSRWVARDSRSSADADLHDRYLRDAVNPRLRSDRGPSLHSLKSIVRDCDFFPSGHSDLADLQERLAAIRLGAFMGAGIQMQRGEWLVLVLHRDLHDSSDFCGDEARVAETLLPHLRQCVRLADRIAAARVHHAELEGALNSLRVGLIACTADARVSWANRSALRMLERRTLLSLSADRVSAASSPHDTFVLRRLVTEAATGVCPSDSHLVVRSPASNETAHILARPLDARRGDDLGQRPDGRVLLMISESANGLSVPPRVIERMLQLSPAESRLAAALCGGLTTNEYASRTGVGIETVRSQLKQVLAKTQAHRQADLVRQICSSVVAQSLEREL